jgi:hypothetical protein
MSVVTSVPALALKAVLGISLDLFQCADGGEVGESFFAKTPLTDPVRCGYTEIAGRFG